MLLSWGEDHACEPPSGADPDCEIGECHVPETHAIPLLLDAAAAESAGFTIYGDDLLNCRRDLWARLHPCD
jgi:hypothetical protein